MYTIVILIFVTGFLNLRKKRKNSSKNLETRERNNNFNIQSIIVRNKKKKEDSIEKDKQFREKEDGSKNERE